LLRGDTMSDEKKGMKKHVTAAREWLGKAEQSFDQENEIKGDLNVMLAQAELQRAQETKTGRITRIYFWFRTLAAVMTAGIIIAVGWNSLYHTSTTHLTSQQSTPVQTAAEDQLKTDQEISKLPSQQTAVVIPSEQKTIHEAGEKSNVVPEQKKIVADNTMQQAAVESEVPDKVVVPKETSMDVPPVKLQLLMRAAGKTLRGQQ